MTEIRATGTEVMAISSDSEERAREIADARGIEFPMLSDPRLEVIEAYGLRHAGGGLEGDIARPATLIVDRRGQVVWRDLADNWRVRPRPSEILGVLRTLD